MPRLLRLRDFRILVLPAAAALLLAACDKGPTGPVQPPGPDELATDAQLRTSEDPAAPAENKAWVDWIRDEAEPVRSLTATRFDDLQFLKTVLAGKRVVGLGESGHGIRQFNQAKVRLIRFLHEEMGYDVIAFESGLHECWQANQRAGSATAQATMNSCIFGVWHTEEVRELFEYIRQTRETSRPLILAGFDVQISSNFSQDDVDLFLRDVVEKVDVVYAHRVAQLDTDFLAEYRRLRGSNTPVGPGYAPLQHFIPAYDSLMKWIDTHQDALAAAYGGNLERPMVARQTAYSRIRYIEESSLGTIERALAREVGMADNLDRLLAYIYPGKKVILWAHNYHLQHDRRSLVPGDGSDPGELGDFNTMGHFVHQRHAAELYTVGFFMYRGSGANNNRTLYNVTPARPGSIESLGYRVRKAQFFLDLSRAKGGGSEWVGQTIFMKDWGVWDFGQVPRNQYNGVFFVDAVTPPEYL